MAHQYFNLRSFLIICFRVNAFFGISYVLSVFQSLRPTDT